MSVTVKPRATVLLTGASGVVGRAVLERLADHAVVCLTHRKPVDAPHAVGVAGDLTRPYFGLGRAAYEELADRVDAVVHCAAVTGFGVDAHLTEDLNVRGTGRVLAFARQAGGGGPPVSTAFVTRRDLARDGGGTARPEVYLDSKRRAEQALLESGAAVNVIRPSVVIGDSVTGRISQFQGLHAIAGALLKGALPLLPLDPGNRIDFVPQDVVADVIAALVRAGTTGGEYWVTGGADAPTARRVVELGLELGRSLGLEPERPRFVEPDMVDRLIRPVFLDALPRSGRRRVDDMLAMTALFDTAEPFASTYHHAPGVERLSAERLEDAFTASMRHYAQEKGLVRPSEVAA
ncbi:SDR family oxidoreductase [Kitasatospora sp. A2-31]|uniref:SDR family oxidoreductase n=1 Tax=Kitasatospora sp. A2-31 TaxID=2916414 RepID=UPI001EEBA566|nr:SDR family oxidoreductase [Kitasatospora sp. A2-31]MCG6498313.1 SDR family oxidoreductase [Kitasatospora sp. A2-31]